MPAGALPFFFAIWAAAGRGAQPKGTPPAPPTPKPKPSEKKQPAPWPQVVPAGLPSFPGSGWVPDHPPGAGVSARAAQLLPVLWKRGKGSWKTEHVKGRWITFQASMHVGKKAVNAYKLATEAPTTAPEPEPTPAPVPVSPPAGPSQERLTLAAKLAENLAGKPKGKENKALVSAYEKMVGLPSDDMYGPKVGYALATDGIVPPSPMYWPKKWNDANKAIKDWKAFCAQQAALETDETRRLAWEESARGARMQPVTPYSATNLQQAAQIFFR
jgi:hypothetical protein